MTTIHNAIRSYQRSRNAIRILADKAERGEITYAALDSAISDHHDDAARLLDEIIDSGAIATHVYVVTVEDSEDPLYVFQHENDAQTFADLSSDTVYTAPVSEYPIVTRQMAAGLIAERRSDLAEDER